MKCRPRRWLAIASALFLSTAWLAVADEPKDQLELLKQNGVESDTESVIGYLQRLQPDAKLQQEIAAVIGELAHPDFAVRQAAFRKLTGYGEAARQLLGKAAKGDDAETRLHAQNLLRDLDSGERAQLRQALNQAALNVLRSRGEAEAVPTLLATMNLLGDDYARGLAAEALWASAGPAHADALEAALDHEAIAIRAAAVVAYELAAGDRAAEKIAPLLKDDDPVMRLAAARALIDRQPKPAIEALVALAGEKGGDFAWQADALLRLKTGQKLELEDGQTLGAAWQAWAAAKLATLKLDAPLGDRRLDLDAGRNILEQNFARAADSLDKGYGPFRYEADNDAPAKVADGKLRLGGESDEGDQRLFVTSQRMIGSPRWPDRLEVRAKLAGEEGNNFGWHIGVSVGRVKTLFHPGQGRGYFRAETTDDHDYLFANENMSFEPVTGVVHEMIIKVRKTAVGADFEVTVNGGKGGEPHKKSFSVTAEQLGAYNRIGLERSGRTGGDALFDSLSIRLGE